MKNRMQPTDVINTVFDMLIDSFDVNGDFKKALKSIQGKDNEIEDKERME